MQLSKGMVLERDGTLYTILMLDTEFALLAQATLTKGTDGNTYKVTDTMSLELYDAKDDFTELGFKET